MPFYLALLSNKGISHSSVIFNSPSHFSASVLFINSFAISDKLPNFLNVRITITLICRNGFLWMVWLLFCVFYLIQYIGTTFSFLFCILAG